MKIAWMQADVKARLSAYIQACAEGPVIITRNEKTNSGPARRAGRERIGTAGPGLLAQISRYFRGRQAAISRRWAAFDTTSYGRRPRRTRRDRWRAP